MGVVDRALGAWRYLPELSSYESGPGPAVSHRRWVSSGSAGDDSAVTFVHDFTTQAGDATHLEFTAKYDGQQYPFHGSALYNTVALRWVSEHEVRQVFQLDGKTTVDATRTVSPDGQRLIIDTGGTLPTTGKAFRNLISYERVADPSSSGAGSVAGTTPGSGSGSGAGPGSASAPAAAAFTATLMLEALAEQGVELCFTNPGTSEMHFVIALDAAAKAGKMRSVLCLFEGVATGAADGCLYFHLFAAFYRALVLILVHFWHSYARMAEKPGKYRRNPHHNLISREVSKL